MGFAGRGWVGRSGSGLEVQEWEWPGSAGGARRAEFAEGLGVQKWECRSGSGLVVLEMLEVQSLLDIYLHQHLFLK